MNKITTMVPLPSGLGTSKVVALDRSTYTELMRLARSHLGRSGTMSLDAPSLVHEAYLRFSKQGVIAPTQRKIFFGYASQVMRAVIVDYVRERRALKRGGGAAMITLTTGIEGSVLGEDSISPLDDALKALKEIDERSHKVVEMRYFGGMTEEEIAELLEVSVPTVKRDWRKARAFLFDAIGEPFQ